MALAVLKIMDRVGVVGLKIKNKTILKVRILMDARFLLCFIELSKKVQYMDIVLCYNKMNKMPIYGRLEVSLC